MKKQITISLVVALGLFAMFLPTALADEEPGSPAPDAWIEFVTGDLAPIPATYPPYTHTQSFDVSVRAHVDVWIWDTGSISAYQDDVVDIYIDGVYLGSADSRGDPPGGVAKLVGTVTLDAGTHEFKMIIVYSEVGGSVWAKKFDQYVPPVPEFPFASLAILPLAWVIYLFAPRLLKKRKH